MIQRKTIQRAALYLTALIVCLVLVAPYFLDLILNSTFVKQKIGEMVQEKSGKAIDPETMDLLVFPRPGLRFREIQIGFNPKVHLDIQALQIDLDIPRLFTGKIAISQIFVETPKIRYIPGQEHPDSVPGPVPGSGSATDTPGVEFPTQEIEKLFALFPHSQDTLELVIQNAQSDYFTAMEGSFRVSNSARTLTMQARIQGLQIQKEQFSETSLLKQMDIHSLESPQINLKLNLDESGTLGGTLQVISPQLVLGQIPDTPLAGDYLDLAFEFSPTLLSVNLKPVGLSYPHGHVGIHFSDDKTAGQTLLTFVGTDIDISQAREIGLTQLGSNSMVSRLFDILRSGRAEQFTLEFKSDTLATLFDENGLFFKGAARDVSVKIPETSLMVDHLHGETVMENGILHVRAHQGQILAAALKAGNLNIHLMDPETTPFTGEFHLDLDLSTLPHTLISLLPNTVLARELARISQVSGRADARVTLNMAQKHLDVQVQTQDISAKGVYDRIPWPLTLTRGKINYTAEQLSIEGVSGSLGTSSVSGLNGTLDFSPSPGVLLKSGTAILDLGALMPWLATTFGIMEMMAPVKHLTGEIGVETLMIQGPMFDPGQWQFDIQGRVTDIDLQLGGDRPEIQGLSSQFKATRQEITLKGLKARVEDLTWLAPGIDRSYVTSIQTPLHLLETQLEMKTGKARFQGQVLFPSGSLLAFDLAGKKPADLYPRSLTLTDHGGSEASVQVSQDNSKPLLEFQGKLNSQTLENLLIQDSSLHRLILSHTAGVPVIISMDPDETLHVNASKIHLDPLITLLNQPKKSQAQPLLALKKMRVNTPELTYKQWAFSDIETLLSFSQDKTQIQILHGNLCTLGITGQVEIFARETRTLSDFTIQARDKTEIADALLCLFKGENRIKGAYSFACKLSGEALLSEIINQQKGSLTLTAHKGRIYKLTLLSRILSVLNIFQLPNLTQEGFGYKHLVVEADIKESVIYLTKAVIDADDMALIFTGWIDPLRDKLNLTCLVAPFKTIDTIVKHIPLINTLLSGRLVSFPVKATGSIADPVVTPLHPSAVGEGLVNMLGDLLKSPGRLFKETP